MLSWLKSASSESAIRKLENGLAASAAKRARVDSKLQEQREIEARARKEIADAHVRPLTVHEDAALDTELDDLMRVLDYFDLTTKEDLGNDPKLARQHAYWISVLRKEAV